MQLMQLSLNQVKAALADKNRFTIVQCAPAVRVAIAEEFGAELNLTRKNYPQLFMLLALTGYTIPTSPGGRNYYGRGNRACKTCDRGRRSSYVLIFLLSGLGQPWRIIIRSLKIIYLPRKVHSIDRRSDF